MPKAKKLPSGSWRCQVYVDGHRKSITVSDPSAAGRRECERQAAEYAANAKRQIGGSMTVGTAIARYIDAKRAVLSVNTVKTYERMQRRDYNELNDIPLQDLTQEIVQLWMDKYSFSHSPKSCRSVHGLLSAAIGMFYPYLVLRTRFPQTIPVDYYTPTDSEIKTLLKETKGSELEKAILLAAFGTLRAGEICALTSDDINGNVITVSKSMSVIDGKTVIKQPKNPSSVRKIEYPAEVIKRFKGINGRLVNLSPGHLGHYLRRAQKRCGIYPFRFHDLRAYSASIMHDKGIPDAYIMERGGWKTDYTLKKVYRRAISPESKKYAAQINQHFSGMLSDV